MTTSKSRILQLVKRLEVERENEYEGEATAWINRDIVPLPPSRRTWGSWSFVGFWLLTGFNISGWTTASSLLGLGLNVWQAMVSVVVGYLIVACAVVANGFVGAEWHVGFPIYNRFVWGVFGSFFPLLMRILLSLVWYGVQLVFGGKSVKVVIGSIWPSFYYLRNTLPPDAGIQTNDLIGILIFAAMSVPLLTIPPEHFRKPFLFGSIIMTVTTFAIFTWALAKEGGGGPLLSHPSQLSGVKPLTEGSQLGWAMAYGVSSTIGGICAGILNQSDYSRFAAYPRAQLVSQMLIVPLSNVMIALFGIIVTSCAAGFYPDDGLLWAPYDLLRVVQLRGGPGARAACFFAGCAFVVSQFGINVAGNAISGGIDLSGLLPKYLNIRRGALLTAALGIAICPWKLLTGSSAFLTVLSSFAVFLGPLTGVMTSDYLVVRQSKLRLSHLYMPNSGSIYYFAYGVNFRALVAWIFGVWPLMPGFVNAVSPNPIGVSIGWTRCYDLAWPLGFVVSAAVHIFLNKVFAPMGLGQTDEDDVFGTFTEKANTMHQDAFTEGDYAD
ncbi:permease for cytosine/purines, uracil, thiamine, allantoin-domain-containing protein [Dichomitus squalens]|uniref:Permease for cytosine/purines, uracil, thiamine, allantoin-domain-containing protein n=1 Tax=Dichomitus squalens TaxID=114155 RepID=A0A4Q9MI74_9APHY|nr:permease for cytosine/purines, uracil, thiamine, allantoin-domain-containing protein [Dichomitus squalens]TBU44556.1 permease for cytosine/purines, uracil, thiamine, allantoin-domain-containing protein [Dichomitus squalens]TBU55266.1 permease for cytosine/purines, uracil, thiamine, allantoin-domain-containing protein [Dichomitus squalens]